MHQQQDFCFHATRQCCGPAFCNCTKQEVAMFMENVCDIANVVAQTMIICGLNSCKVRMAVDEIRYALLNYDEIRGFDGFSRKRLRKEDFMHELGRKCLMTLTEAQLTNAIVQRAFRAFNYGNGKINASGSLSDAQLQSVWAQAAKRIAQIFAKRKGLRCRKTQEECESEIKRVFQSLCERLKQRGASAMLDTGRICEHCKRGMTNTENADMSKPLSSLPKSKSTSSVVDEEQEKPQAVLIKSRSSESLVYKEIVVSHCGKHNSPECHCNGKKTKVANTVSAESNSCLEERNIEEEFCTTTSSSFNEEDNLSGIEHCFDVWGPNRGENGSYKTPKSVTACVCSEETVSKRAEERVADLKFENYGMLDEHVQAMPTKLSQPGRSDQFGSYITNSRPKSSEFSSRLKRSSTATTRTHSKSSATASRSTTPQMGDISPLKHSPVRVTSPTLKQPAVAITKQPCCVCKHERLPSLVTYSNTTPVGPPFISSKKFDLLASRVKKAGESMEQNQRTESEPSATIQETSEIKLADGEVGIVKKTKVSFAMDMSDKKKQRRNSSSERRDEQSCQKTDANEGASAIPKRCRIPEAPTRTLRTYNSDKFPSFIPSQLPTASIRSAEKPRPSRAKETKQKNFEESI